MNCPFYGRVAAPNLQILVQREGSVNCALSIGPYLTPCKMQADGKKPEWAKCDENTGAPWKNRMLEWAKNGERETMLIQFDYPD
jgi:hypothetical protein